MNHGLIAFELELSHKSRHFLFSELTQVVFGDGCLVVEGGREDFSVERNIWAGYTGPTFGAARISSESYVLED